MKQIHLRVNEEIYNKIKNEVKIKKTTMQEYIIKTIGKDLTIKESPANYNVRPEKYKFKFIDLFAGIGGTRLGFESAGGKCVFTCEWDKYCQITYEKNFGDKPFGDIRLVDVKVIPPYDILVAGFPCQPFSLAGVSKKNSLGRPTGFLDKTQGTLFFEVARILKGYIDENTGETKKPKAFLLENVKNLVTHDKGRTFNIIKNTLNELGYKIFYKVIDAVDYVPQHRERIFIVGFNKEIYGKNIQFDFPEKPDIPEPTLKDILDDSVDAKYTLSDKLWNYLQEYAKKHKAKGNGFGYGLADINSHSRTLSARYHKDGSEILIPQKGKNPRKLTPRECARLMGFHDDFKIEVSNTQAYHQFGNSVVVPVIEAIAGQIVEVMDNERLNNNLRNNLQKVL
ncbi:DNA (cytosine-5-)-methyltransferase [Clostridium tyrobutyricum]|uniref:DNA (cytosine-5-)-methyltransferase n=1 Tax=Clostridium tyrobutyricum TaxID=1519 RepID=UPI001C388B58|nr:DNA (cytosine-5-)-methyltransferase [Clostridium tyrobutyricum]MBV4414668.1 DNA (cytosine-5-)-methyltransferase [Clostridium tyrobutyricum]